MFKTRLCKALRFKVVSQERGEGVALHQPFLIACPEFLWLNSLALEESVCVELGHGACPRGAWRGAAGGRAPQEFPNPLLNVKLIHLSISAQKDGDLGSELDSELVGCSVNS